MRKFFLIFISIPIMVFSHEDIKEVKYIENKGQWSSNILYKAKIPEGTVYLEKDQFTYCFHNSKQLEAFHHISHENKEDKQINIDMFSFKMQLLGVNENAMTNGEEILTEYHNYFIGNDKRMRFKVTIGWSTSDIKHITLHARYTKSIIFCKIFLPSQ